LAHIEMLFRYRYLIAYFTVVRPTYQVHHEWWQSVEGTFASLQGRPHSGRPLNGRTLLFNVINVMCVF